jgi:hypothetical protein
MFVDKKMESEKSFKEAAIIAAKNKCLNSSQRFVYICLQGCVTNQDKIEIAPGIEADVLVHGQIENHGLNRYPTIAVVECKHFRSSIEK